MPIVAISNSIISGLFVVVIDDDGGNNLVVWLVQSGFNKNEMYCM